MGDFSFAIGVREGFLGIFRTEGPIFPGIFAVSGALRMRRAGFYCRFRGLSGCKRDFSASARLRLVVTR